MEYRPSDRPGTMGRTVPVPDRYIRHNNTPPEPGFVLQRTIARNLKTSDLDFSGQCLEGLLDVLDRLQER